MAKSLLVDYRSKFIQHMTGAMNNVVQACKVLAEAKGKLAKGDFGKLINDLNLSPRDAEKYVRIGNDKRFDAIEVKDNLPYAWTVLDRISSLDDDQFKEAVKSGLINPTTTRAEIDAFKSGEVAPMGEDEQSDPNSVKVATIWVDKSKHLGPDLLYFYLHIRGNRRSSQPPRVARRQRSGVDRDPTLTYEKKLLLLLLLC